VSERIDCRTVTEFKPNERYVHVNAESVGECASGCCTDFRCPDCGTEFRVEYPD
jgi:hypothetical protein